MMKRIMLLMIVFMISAGAYAQIEAPVKWSYAAKRLNNSEAVIFLRATIQDGWHIYSMNVKDGGPIKTSFTFAKSNEYTQSSRENVACSSAKRISNFSR